MKLYQTKLTEDEVLAVISFHAQRLLSGMPEVETTKRIHDLTKRLNNSMDSDTEQQPEFTKPAGEVSGMPDGWANG